MTPSWLEHSDLMSVLIVSLLVIIGILLAYIFRSLTEKIDGIKECLRTKADDENNNEVHGDLWRRINHHSHIVVCDSKTCKPKCESKVVIDEVG